MSYLGMHIAYSMRDARDGLHSYPWVWCARFRLSNARATVQVASADDGMSCQRGVQRLTDACARGRCPFVRYLDGRRRYQCHIWDAVHMACAMPMQCDIRMVLMHALLRLLCMIPTFECGDHSV